eukprot:15454177-Alexandrium_andersonii.AAC.1
MNFKSAAVLSPEFRPTRYLLASLHRRVPNVQSAIRPMPLNAAIRPFRHSNLELRGPRNASKSAPEAPEA